MTAPARNSRRRDWLFVTGYSIGLAALIAILRMPEPWDKLLFIFIPGLIFLMTSLSGSISGLRAWVFMTAYIPGLVALIAAYFIAMRNPLDLAFPVELFLIFFVPSLFGLISGGYGIDAGIMSRRPAEGDLARLWADRFGTIGLVSGTVAALAVLGLMHWVTSRSGPLSAISGGCGIVAGIMCMRSVEGDIGRRWAHRLGVISLVSGIVGVAPFLLVSRGQLRPGLLIPLLFDSPSIIAGLAAIALGRPGIKSMMILVLLLALLLGAIAPAFRRG